MRHHWPDAYSAEQVLLNKRQIYGGAPKLHWYLQQFWYRCINLLSDLISKKCSVIWSPHYKKDKVLLERVQHRFTRMFPELKDLPYKQRLAKLKLWSLEERRNRANLIEIFKMIKWFSAVSWFHLFTRVKNSITRGHNWKLAKTRSCHDSRLFFFSQRAVNRWNSLMQDEVDAPTINSFKNYLEKRRNRQMDFFMD